MSYEALYGDKSDEMLRNIDRMAARIRVYLDEQKNTPQKPLDRVTALENEVAWLKADIYLLSEEIKKLKQAQA